MITEDLVNKLFQQVSADFEPQMPDLTTGMPDGMFIAFGAVGFAFLDGRALADHADSIVELLGELPVQFQHDYDGGGFNFEEAVRDKDGHTWTSDYNVIDKLVCMGIGIKRLRFINDRKEWADDNPPWFQINLESGYDLSDDLYVVGETVNPPYACEGFEALKDFKPSFEVTLSELLRKLGLTEFNIDEAIEEQESYGNRKDVTP